MSRIPIFGTVIETDAMSLAPGPYVDYSDLESASRRRLLYEGAAAEVADTMLAFLTSHRTVSVRLFV